MEQIDYYSVGEVKVPVFSAGQGELLTQEVVEEMVQMVEKKVRRHLRLDAV